MNILCSWFGHKLDSPPEFNEGGMFCTFKQKCGRCDFELKGIVPPQHQHVYGHKRKFLGKWMYECRCGHTKDAPVPKPRKANGVGDAT